MTLKAVITQLKRFLALVFLAEFRFSVKRWKDKRFVDGGPILSISQKEVLYFLNPQATELIFIKKTTTLISNC